MDGAGGQRRVSQPAGAYPDVPPGAASAAGPAGANPDLPAGAYLDMPVGRFLGLLAAGEPAPGGGAAAALAVALAASLCAMSARLSPAQLPDASELAADAERLSGLVASLGQADAESYGRVLAALRLPKEPGPERRKQEIATALSAAADVPMRVVEIGTQVAALGARVAAEGNPNLRGDAATAALLAEAGARAAALLVRINLAGDAGDDRPARAQRLLAQAAAAAGRAAAAARLG